MFDTILYLAILKIITHVLFNLSDRLNCFSVIYFCWLLSFNWNTKLSKFCKVSTLPFPISAKKANGDKKESTWAIVIFMLIYIQLQKVPHENNNNKYKIHTNGNCISYVLILHEFLLRVLLFLLNINDCEMVCSNIEHFYQCFLLFLTPFWYAIVIISSDI